jgi:hypothetical protein
MEKNLRDYIDTETQKIANFTTCEDYWHLFNFVCDGDDDARCDIVQRLEDTLHLMIKNGFTDSEIYNNSKMEKINNNQMDEYDNDGINYIPIDLDYYVVGNIISINF